MRICNAALAATSNSPVLAQGRPSVPDTVPIANSFGGIYIVVRQFELGTLIYKGPCPFPFSFANVELRGLRMEMSSSIMKRNQHIKCLKVESGYIRAKRADVFILDEGIIPNIWVGECYIELKMVK